MPIDPSLLPRPRKSFEFVPRGEIIEIPEKNLRIYYVDQEQIEAFLRYYGVHSNGHNSEGLRPFSQKELKEADLQEPKSAASQKPKSAASQKPKSADSQKPKPKKRGKKDGHK